MARRSALVALLIVVTLAMAELARMFLTDHLSWSRVVTVVLGALAWVWLLRRVLKADRLLREAAASLHGKAGSETHEHGRPSSP